jgi:hypothetical protein
MVGDDDDFEDMFKDLDADPDPEPEAKAEPKAEKVTRKGKRPPKVEIEDAPMPKDLVTVTIQTPEAAAPARVLTKRTLAELERGKRALSR